MHVGCVGCIDDGGCTASSYSGAVCHAASNDMQCPPFDVEQQALAGMHGGHGVITSSSSDVCTVVRCDRCTCMCGYGVTQ